MTFNEWAPAAAVPAFEVLLNATAMFNHANLRLRARVKLTGLPALPFAQAGAGYAIGSTAESGHEAR